MIANVSPAATCYEDTYNTLKYADRANKIQLSIKKNIVDGDMRVSQYVKVIEELKKKVKELEAKLTLSSVQRSDPAPQDWRRRILIEAEINSSLLHKVISLSSRARVLCLRHRLRTRALSHVAEMVHRSSTEAMEQMCTEDLPRQERATEKYNKEALELDARILAAWTKWNESKDRLEQICQQALSNCPELQDFVENIHVQTQLKHLQGKADLSQKLLALQNNEINAFTDYMSDMPNMLKKLYLTLKGYDKVTPTLTAEYMKIMKKAKAAKGISWSDADCDDDPHFKYIIDFDLDKPLVQENIFIKKEDINGTIDFATDSEDLTDIENKEPVRLSAKKRKGTPIKLFNNETIIIDDSLENLDVTKTLNSNKKLKREMNVDFQDHEIIKPVNLNSTFDMAGKVEALKMQIKNQNSKNVNLPVKRELADRTNTMPRTISHNNAAGARIVKPVIGKAAPFRRGPVPASSQPPGSRPPAFGSSLSRDGTPLTRNIQAMRARERVQTHPYSRPTAFNQRK